MGMLLSRHHAARASSLTEQEKTGAHQEPAHPLSAVDRAARALVSLDDDAPEATALERLAEVRGAFEELRAKCAEASRHAESTSAELAKVAADAREAQAKAEAERDAALTRSVELQRLIDEMTAPAAASSAEEKPPKGPKK